MSLLQRFWRDERGATVIEYGLICGLIFLAIVASVRSFASNTGGMYGRISAAMS